jgi:hypothetical protein
MYVFFDKRGIIRIWYLAYHNHGKFKDCGKNREYLNIADWVAR